VLDEAGATVRQLVGVDHADQVGSVHGCDSTLRPRYDEVGLPCNTTMRPPYLHVCHLAAENPPPLIFATERLQRSCPLLLDEPGKKSLRRAAGA
jgi:hypothetical protein